MIVDDPLERRIWNTDNFVEKFFEFFCFCCVNHWIIDFSMLVRWRFVDDPPKKHWRFSKGFHANNNHDKCFHWPNLRSIDVSLLLPGRSLMILWRDVFRILIISMATFLIFSVFVVLTSESMMFHCCLIDYSLLMILWRDVDETLMISMQTSMIIFFCCGSFRNIDVLLLLRRWALMMLCRDLFETVIVSMKTFSIFVVRNVLNSETLMFHCFFIYDSLMTLRRIIADTTNIWTQTFLINRAFNVHYFKFWCFLAAWLINGCWWHFQETLMGPWGFRCKQ